MGLVCTIRNRGERTETRSRVKKRNIYRYIPRADLRRLRSFAQLTETCQLTGFFAFSHLDAKLRILAGRSTFTGHRRPPGIREKPGRQRDTLFELVSGQSCVLSNTFFFFASSTCARVLPNPRSIDSGFHYRQHEAKSRLQNESRSMFAAGYEFNVVFFRSIFAKFISSAELRFTLVVID